MSRIKFSLSFLVVFIIYPVLCQGQDLNKILKAHFAAQGQENLMAMRSIFMKVREMNGFTEGKKYQITKKALNKIRVEGEWQGQKYVNAFDGKYAWTIAPWTGVHIPQLMTERERNLFLMNVGIGSPLYDYGLGHVHELIGSERADDANHYVIRSTMPSGFYVDYLIDKKDHLIHLVRVYQEEDPTKIEKEVIFKNYKNLGGVSIPFGFENRKGREVSDVVVDDIIFGQGASNSLFNKPE